MFEPTYHISPRLLDAIKRIAVLTHELNKYHIPDLMYAELLSEALYASA